MLHEQNNLDESEHCKFKTIIFFTFVSINKLSTSTAGSAFGQPAVSAPSTNFTFGSATAGTAPNANPFGTPSTTGAVATTGGFGAFSTPGGATVTPTFGSSQLPSAPTFGTPTQQSSTPGFGKKEALLFSWYLKPR